jgi:hypothetical protein
MAIVILGGLVTTTLYSLFAVPAMYLLFTPSRVAELDDLEVSLVGERELRESIGGANDLPNEVTHTKELTPR